MDYSNIMNAIGGQNPQMDDLNRRTDNYRIAEEMSRQGTSLKDVLGQIEELKRKVDGLEKPAKAMDEDLFRVMEQAVRDCQPVVDAGRRMADEKARVVLELCMKDAGYRQAYDAYKDAVNRAYVSSKEEKE